jgi:hypothetical protein
MDQHNSGTRHWCGWLTAERGSQLLEWVIIGSLQFILIVALLSVITGHQGLRSEITATVTRFAINFGRDVIARGPNIPDGRLIQTNVTLRVAIDPRTGAYVAIDPETGARLTVTPGDSLLVTVNTTEGVISLSDPARDLTVFLSPVQNEAALIDHTTGVRQAINLERLQELDLVTVTYERMTPLSPIDQFNGMR